VNPPATSTQPTRPTATPAAASTTPPTTPTPSPDAWTTRRLLDWIKSAFTKAGLDSPKLSAEILLAHVLRCERLRLYMDADRVATDAERETLRNLVSRALKHEPIQYLVGEWWFFGLPFNVDKRVLIPRPSTETLVELAIDHLRAQSHQHQPQNSDETQPEETPTPAARADSDQPTTADLTFIPAAPIILQSDGTPESELDPDEHDDINDPNFIEDAKPAQTVPVQPLPIAPHKLTPKPRPNLPTQTVIDLCTGSGCVAIAIANRLHNTRVIAIDLSQDALDVARANASRHNLASRIDFIKADATDPKIYEALANHPWLKKAGAAAILANPPYIPDHEWLDVQPNVKDHEPSLALRAGPTGLDVINPIITHAPALLTAGALIAIEVATSHAKQAQQTLECHHPQLTNARTINDCDGQLRVITAITA